MEDDLLPYDMSPRERKMLADRYEKRMTLAAIGEQEGLSKTRPAQILAKAERKLRFRGRFLPMLVDGFYDKHPRLYAVVAGEHMSEGVRRATDEERARVAASRQLAIDAEAGTALWREFESIAGTRPTLALIRTFEFPSPKHLAQLTPEDISLVRNIGTDGMQAVARALDRLGITLSRQEECPHCRGRGFIRVPAEVKS